MIVNNNYTTATGTVCDNATQQFTIAQTPEVMELLSKGLYKDPYMAIVRELYCNAWDSHVMAGNTATPVQITVPTQLEPNFSIKDFGTGLCEEDVMTMYTTYGISTKRDSNSVIGCLGVGSKAPFAIVDEFTVISRYEGMASMYHCYKSKGLMQITKIHSHPTDEHSGMEIIVAAPDRIKIEQACIEFFRFVDPSHYSINCAINKSLSDAIIKVDGYSVYPCVNKTYNEVLIKMGEVVYKFCDLYTNIAVRADTFEASPTVTPHQVSVRPHQDWHQNVLEVPIGTFTTTASRESIDKSEENLQKFVKIQQLIMDAANKRLSEANIKTAVSCYRFNGKIAFLPEPFRANVEISKLYRTVNNEIEVYRITPRDTTRCNKPVKSLVPRTGDRLFASTTKLYNCDIKQLDLRLIAKFFSGSEILLVDYKTFLKLCKPTVTNGTKGKVVQYTKYEDILYTYKGHNRDYKIARTISEITADTGIPLISAKQAGPVGDKYGVSHVSRYADRYSKLDECFPYIPLKGTRITEGDYKNLQTLQEMRKVLNDVPLCVAALNQTFIKKYGVPSKFVPLDKYIADRLESFNALKKVKADKDFKSTVKTLLFSRDNSTRFTPAKVFGFKDRGYRYAKFPAGYEEISELYDQISKELDGIQKIGYYLQDWFASDVQELIITKVKEKYASKIEEYRKNGWKNLNCNGES